LRGNEPDDPPAEVTAAAAVDGVGGTVTLRGDTPTVATVLEAIDAAAPPPRASTDDDGVPLPGRVRESLGQRRAAGLLRVCEEWLARNPTPADPDGTQRRARPTLLAVIDAERLAGGRGKAEVVWRLAGGTGRVSVTDLDVLACDATLVPVLTRGAVATAVGDATAPISTPLRHAVIARDGTCRFPGCRAPAVMSDIHHVIPREEDRKSTRLNSSHGKTSYAVFGLKKKKTD